MNDLLLHIRRVADARRMLASAQSEYQAALAAFEQQHADLISELATARTIVSDTEAALRAATIEAYEATGNKQPADGIGIRVVKVVNYPAVTAVAWAFDHKVALKFDDKAFERLMLATSPEARPEWLTIDEVPQATIARDLNTAGLEVAP